MDNFWLAVAIVGGIVLAWAALGCLMVCAVWGWHEFKMWRTWRIIATSEARKSAEPPQGPARIFRIR